MLKTREFYWLRNLLLTGELVKPLVVARELGNDVQRPNACHLISQQAGVQFGEPPVIGVQFLDLHGKLYPWSHMVNNANGVLVDYSQTRPIRRDFGFIRAEWGDYCEWREVLAVYQLYGREVEIAPRWSDELADQLTDEFWQVLHEVK